MSARSERLLDALVADGIFTAWSNDDPAGWDAQDAADAAWRARPDTDTPDAPRRSGRVWLLDEDDRTTPREDTP